MEEKKYYKIKDVSEMLDENPSTLRYWESEFNELSPKRTGKGRRLYTSKDIETLRIIKYLLRTKGMHITIAREQMQSNRNNLSKRTEAIVRLEKVRGSLQKLYDSLKKIKDPH